MSPHLEWLDIVVVDAFTPTSTSSSFGGNPAAVVILDPSKGIVLDEGQKQAIAFQMNLSETAFVTPLMDSEAVTPGLTNNETSSGKPMFRLQWFTPQAEVALCGHATVAATSVLSWLPAYKDVSVFTYDTLSGPLSGKVLSSSSAPSVSPDSPASSQIPPLRARIELDFPADVPTQTLDDKYILAYAKSVRGLEEEDIPEIVRVWKGKFDIVFEVESKRLQGVAGSVKDLGDLQFDPFAFVSTVLPSSRVKAFCDHTFDQGSICFLFF